MAVVYTTAVKNARLEAVVTQIGSAGVLEVGTTGMGTVLFSVTLDNPAGTASGGVLTFSGFPKNTTASAAGTAAAARIRTGTGGTDIVTGLTVGTSSADVIVNTTTNVAPIDSATPGTAILPAVDGAWAQLLSDGTNWIIVARG